MTPLKSISVLTTFGPSEQTYQWEADAPSVPLNNEPEKQWMSLGCSLPLSVQMSRAVTDELSARPAACCQAARWHAGP